MEVGRPLRCCSQAQLEKLASWIRKHNMQQPTPPTTCGFLCSW